MKKQYVAMNAKAMLLSEYEEKWQALSEDSTMDPRSIAVAKALRDQEITVNENFEKILAKRSKRAAK